MILGVLVFTSNFTVLCILCTKGGKRPSELLVIFSLLIDSLYGVWIFNCSIYYLWEYYVWDFFLLDLSFISLTTGTFQLHILVSINRYIAVLKPFSYKNYFTYFKVVFAFLVIFMISLSSSFLWFVLLLKTDEPQVYITTWRFLRLAMVLIEGVLTIAVYKCISKQFAVSLWQPAMTPVKEMTDLLRVCLSPKSNFFVENLLLSKGTT